MAVPGAGVVVLRDVVMLGGTGVALGLGAVVALRRWIDPVLYETSALDLATLGAVAATVPGRRAVTADPVEALRSE